MNFLKRFQKSIKVFIPLVREIDQADTDDLFATVLIVSAIIFFPILILISLIATYSNFSFKNDFSWENLFITYIYSSAILLTASVLAIVWFKAITVLYDHTKFCLRQAWYSTSKKAIAMKLFK